MTNRVSCAVCAHIPVCAISRAPVGLGRWPFRPHPTTEPHAPAELRFSGKSDDHPGNCRRSPPHSNEQSCQPETKGDVSISYGGALALTVRRATVRRGSKGHGHVDLSIPLPPKHHWIRVAGRHKGAAAKVTKSKCEQQQPIEVHQQEHNHHQRPPPPPTTAGAATTAATKPRTSASPWHEKLEQRPQLEH